MSKETVRLAQIVEIRQQRCFSPFSLSSETAGLPGCRDNGEKASEGMSVLCSPTQPSHRARARAEQLLV